MASIRQWTCSGAWPIFVLTLTILSHTGTLPSSVHPTKCWNLSPVCPPSLVLSETPSSASLQNKREVASISGYASLVPLVSVSELASKVSSVRPKVRRPLFNRRDNLRVYESASEGSSGNGSLPSPSHERQANAKHDDVRPVLPPEPAVEGRTLGYPFGRSLLEARHEGSHTPVMLQIPLAFEGLSLTRRLSTMNSMFKQAIHRGERSTSWQGLAQTQRRIPLRSCRGKADGYPNES